MENSDFGADKLEALIGKLVTRWNHMEDGHFGLLYELFIELGSLKFEVLKNEIDLRVALALIKNIGLTTPDEHISEHMVHLSSSVDTILRPFRNRVIHDPVYILKDDFERTTYRSKSIKPRAFEKSFSTMQFTKITENELEEFINAVVCAEVYCGEISSTVRSDPMEPKPHLVGARASFDEAIAKYTNSTNQSESI